MSLQSRIQFPITYAVGIQEFFGGEGKSLSGVTDLPLDFLASAEFLSRRKKGHRSTMRFNSRQPPELHLSWLQHNRPLHEWWRCGNWTSWQEEDVGGGHIFGKPKGSSSLAALWTHKAGGLPIPVASKASLLPSARGLPTWAALIPQLRRANGSFTGAKSWVLTHN